MLSVGSAAFIGGLGTAALLSNSDYSSFGIIAGSTSSSTSLDDLKTAAVNQFHIGVVARLPLPLGLNLQPALMYNVKGTLVDGDIQNIFPSYLIVERFGIFRIQCDTARTGCAASFVDQINSPIGTLIDVVGTPTLIFYTSEGGGVVQGTG